MIGAASRRQRPVNALVIARFTVQEAISRRLVLAGAVLSLAFVGAVRARLRLPLRRVARDSAARPAQPTRLVMAGDAADGARACTPSTSCRASWRCSSRSAPSRARSTPARSTPCWPARSVAPSSCWAAGWPTSGIIALYVGLMAALLLLVARLIAGYEAPDAPRAIALMMLRRGAAAHGQPARQHGAVHAGQRRRGVLAVRPGLAGRHHRVRRRRA